MGTQRDAHVAPGTLLGGMRTLWVVEFPSSHVEHGFLVLHETCPTVRPQYEVWMGEDGVCVRKRDFLWIVPRLLAWSRRAIARVEREYAPEGPRGREIIEGWEAFQ